MKWLNTLTVMAVTASAVLISCENEDKTKTPVPPTQELQNVTNTINNIVSEHGNYDINNVQNTLKNVLWYCDALVEFSGEWASEIINDFGGEPWIEEYEPMLEFNGNGNLKRYTISSETSRVVDTHGEWSLDTESRTLSIEAEAIEQYNAMTIDAELLALTEDVMVIRWTDQSNDVWCAVYRKYQGILWSIEANILINTALEDICNYDPTSIEQSIAGKWEGNTYVEYDSEWQHVTSPMVVFGSSYSDGISLGVYTFNEDGTFNLLIETEYPLDEDTSYNGTWSFNRDNRTLSLNADGFNREYTIVGYSDELFFGDFVANNKNYRDGLVRIND